VFWSNIIIIITTITNIIIIITNIVKAGLSLAAGSRGLRTFFKCIIQYNAT
jgi:hypothetical protein